MGRNRLIELGTVIFSFFLSFYFYPQLPTRLASHWNIKGQVDGYMPKSIALFIIPSIGLLIYGGLFLLPHWQKSMKEMQRYFDRFSIVLFLFLGYIHVLMLSWNMGRRFNFIQFFLPALAILFLSISTLLKHTKRNYFIGIRTPWTLQDDEVWRRTHSVGAQLFMIIGVMMFIAILIPNYAFLVVMSAIVGITLFLILYSYWIYRDIHKNN